jgi:hypothetical protein
MRNLARLGTLAAGVLALGSPAGATAITYNINGELGNLTNICFNIAVSLTNRDCSYAKTRAPSGEWRGPIEGSAFYPIGSTGDNIDYIPVAGDGKLALPLSGTLTVDDNNTPADGTDDLISGTFVFGAAAFNASTGNGDRAVERWSSWTHTMAPTPVDDAVAQGGGGFRYRIGSRGDPTPAPLFIAGNASDTFPSENAQATLVPPPVWDGTAAATSPSSARVGIERSIGFGLGGTGNVGATTTAVLDGYSCEDKPGDSDCDGINASQTSSASLFGPNRNGPDDFSAPFATAADGDPNSIPLGPGFSNVVLILTTSTNAITSAEAYWTREYQILGGPFLNADDPDDLNGDGKLYLVNNSWGGGRFTFTGSLCQDTPVAVADSANAIEDTATQVAVLANDTCGTEPNTLSIVTPPANGTAVVSGTSIQYTPGVAPGQPFFSGADTFRYRLTDNDGESSEADVNVTVSEKVPNAASFTASSSGGNPTSAIVVLTSSSLGSGAASDHTVSITAQGTRGTCTADSSAGTVRYAPTAGSGNGSDSCTYQIEDADGDTDTGTITVSVSGNSSGSGGGSSGPQLPGGSSSFDLLTLGALLAGLPLTIRRRKRTR